MDFAAAIAAIAASSLWLVCELAVLKGKRAADKSADKKDYVFMYFIQAATAGAGIFLGYFFKMTQSGLYNPSPVFPLAGAALLFAGVAIRLTAISRLKEFFTVNIAIRENHRLITEGLYKTIRHPAYTGQLMCFAGLGLQFGDPFLFMLVFLPDLILILLRIRREEAMLAANFGQAYAEYRARTKKLIPHIF
ncbi:MAG: isoprenylcysteine carboxylmethyltransferase family protein [Eubacteriales bacterium]